jgi:hypothetical protein
MLPIVQALLSQGLGLIGNAVMAKGKAVIEEKLGVDIESALTTPEGKLQLLHLQHEKEEMLLQDALENRRIDLQEFQTEATDRANARDMQTSALSQSDWLPKNFIYYFAIFWSLFAAAYMVAITFLSVPEANVRFADMFSGFLLGTIIAAIMQYFFGSTVRNRGKDNTIATLVQRKSE